MPPFPFLSSKMLVIKPIDCNYGVVGSTSPAYSVLGIIYFSSITLLHFFWLLDFLYHCQLMSFRHHFLPSLYTSSLFSNVEDIVLTKISLRVCNTTYRQYQGKYRQISANFKKIQKFIYIFFSKF